MMRTFIKILILRIKICKSWQIIVINCLEILKQKGALLRKNVSSLLLNLNLGKLYLIPKIHKRLESVPGRPVISNCVTPIEKVSEFLDS